MINKHPSNSRVQHDAQQVILQLAQDWLPAKWQVPELPAKVLRIRLSDSAFVEVDGQSLDPLVLAEVYSSPRQKGLLPGQKKKLATDILKLVTIRQSNLDPWSNARCVLLFSSQNAVDGITGWLREAANIWKIDLIVVPGIDDALEKSLSEAQMLQGQWISDANPDV